MRGVWQRHGLLTKHERLPRLEKATAERKLSLTDDQVRLLERFSPEFRERHIEALHTGALVAVDTFFVGVLKSLPLDPNRSAANHVESRRGKSVRRSPVLYLPSKSPSYLWRSCE